MFNGFPILTPKLINTLEHQGFKYFVKQDYNNCNTGIATGRVLFSPFKEPDKAQYYFRRLRKVSNPDFFDLENPVEKQTLVTIAESAKQISLTKIIEHNYILADTVRNQLAQYIRSNYPQHFALMVKNNFRIIIGDNFGEVFYTVRIGLGIIVSVKDAMLNH